MDFLAKLGNWLLVSIVLCCINVQLFSVLLNAITKIRRVENVKLIFYALGWITVANRPL